MGACPYSNNVLYSASNGASFHMFCDLGYSETADVVDLKQTSDMQTCMESCRNRIDCAAVTFMQTNCTLLRTLDMTQAMPGAVSANITDVVVNITTILTLSSMSTVSDFGGTATASAAVSERWMSFQTCDPNFTIDCHCTSTHVRFGWEQLDTEWRL